MIGNKFVLGIKFRATEIDVEMKHCFSHDLTSKLVDSIITRRKRVSKQDISFLMEIEDHARMVFTQIFFHFCCGLNP